MCNDKMTPSPSTKQSRAGGWTHSWMVTGLFTTISIKASNPHCSLGAAGLASHCSSCSPKCRVCLHIIEGIPSHNIKNYFHSTCCGPCSRCWSWSLSWFGGRRSWLGVAGARGIAGLMVTAPGRAPRGESRPNPCATPPMSVGN